jgi:D-alanyl-D-alanine endopeptidase (penicillin-binding protein 7)
MTAAFWLRNIGSFATQALVLVAAGVAVWRLTRVRHGAVSHVYWRTLLLACLLLPLAQPWRTPPPHELALTTATAIEAASLASASDVAKTAAMTALPLKRAASTSQWVLVVLVAGIAARALWLGIGAFNLRRLRRSAVPVDPPTPGIRDARANVGISAAVCVSPRVAGPITFGFRRPLVILPPDVLGMDDVLQEAIVSHELLHIRRHDWLNVIAEEIVRTIFWFHPAIWWLINRIQLSREHVVDEAVVVLTKSRERYVEAMLAVALWRSPLAVAAAPQFLRRRSLKRRVAHILQETTMTTRRLIASVAATAGVLLVTGVLVVRAFPLEAQAPQNLAPKSAAAPVEIAQGGDHLLHGALPEYPHRAVEQRIEGDVVLDLTIDDRGEVSDARVLSGPEPLRRAALESVLQWHFSPEKLRSTSAQAVLRFTVPSEIDVSEASRMKDVLVATLKIKEPDPRESTVQLEFERPITLERQMVELTRALQEPSLQDSQRAEFMLKLANAQHRLAELREVHSEEPRMKVDKAPLETLRLSRITAERVSPELMKVIQDRAGVKTGDQISEDVLKQIVAAAASVDEHFHVRWERDGKGGLIVFIIAP